MMATLNIEAILDRVQELKQDNAEKDEVIRAQQIQITELEARTESLEENSRELERKLASLADNAARADELIERLNQILS